MTFEEINNAIEEIRKNLDGLESTFDSIQECARKSRWLTAKEVAERIGVSVGKARQILNRADCPSFNDGGTLLINEVALFNFFQKKRTEDEWERK